MSEAPSENFESPDDMSEAIDETSPDLIEEQNESASVDDERQETEIAPQDQEKDVSEEEVEVVSAEEIKEESKDVGIEEIKAVSKEEIADGSKEEVKEVEKVKEAEIKENEEKETQLVIDEETYEEELTEASKESVEEKQQRVDLTVSVPKLTYEILPCKIKECAMEEAIRVPVPIDIKQEKVLQEKSVESFSGICEEDRKDQETQSIDYMEPTEYSLSGELVGKSSFLNALFNKSIVPHDKYDFCSIQVTIFLPNNESITKLYKADINISELRRDVGEMIGENPDRILLSLMGNSSGDYLGDWTPLMGIPPNSVGGLIMNLNFKYDVELKSITNFPSVETYAPIITVRKVKIEDIVGRWVYVTVVIEDISYVKKWLGGFRNIKTGQMYHNASTETRFWDRKPKLERQAEFNSRNSQTHLPYLTKCTQIDANKSTQMWRPDHYIQNHTDKVITPKPYVEYDLLNEQQGKLQSAIKIQRWYRRMVSRKNIRKAFSMLIDLIKKQRERRCAAENSKNAEQMVLLIGVSFPTTRNDFYHLYSAISSWWNKEYADISSIKSISERRAAYYILLQDEISLLFALEKQRIKSRKESLIRRDLKLIENSSRPIVRHQRKGNMTIVDTLEIQRAREIKEVFMTYARQDLDEKDRINVLLSISNVVETFDDMDYAKDLLELLRREIDMLSMGISQNCLKGLRKRIEEGLLHFFRDKNFNPQVQNFRPIHFARINLRSHRCKGCRKLKTPNDFALHVRLKSYWNCRSCEWLRLTSHSVLDITPYANILKLLRAREITKCPRSIYCFLIQPFGTFTIINEIWNGKSALSESRDLSSLRLSRWDNKREWTPWNTILLTAEEAEVHERILNNEEVYEDEFVQSVKLKHINTKYQFNVIDETDKYCRETGLWDTALDENIYQHMFHRRETIQFMDPTFKLPPNKAFVSSGQYKRNPCN